MLCESGHGAHQAVEFGMTTKTTKILCSGSDTKPKAAPTAGSLLERIEQPANRVRSRFCWPDSAQDGILIVSDDEGVEVRVSSAQTVHV